MRNFKLNEIKCIKSEMNKQYTDSIMKLGGPKKKKTLHPSFMVFPPFVNMFPFPKLPSTKHCQYQSPLSTMWLVFVHPWQLWFLSTNKKRSNNRTFVKLKIYCKFCKLAVFQSKDCPCQFYCSWTIYILAWWLFFMNIAIFQQLIILHIHVQLIGIFPMIPRLGIKFSSHPFCRLWHWLGSSHVLFPKEPRTLIYFIHSFIHSLIRSFFQTLFFKQSTLQIFQEVNKLINPSLGERVLFWRWMDTDHHDEL